VPERRSKDYRCASANSRPKKITDSALGSKSEHCVKVLHGHAHTLWDLLHVRADRVIRRAVPHGRLNILHRGTRLLHPRGKRATKGLEVHGSGLIPTIGLALYARRHYARLTLHRYEDIALVIVFTDRRAGCRREHKVGWLDRVTGFTPPLKFLGQSPWERHECLAVRSLRRFDTRFFKSGYAFIDPQAVRSNIVPTQCKQLARCNVVAKWTMMRSRVVGSASIGATYSSIVRNCSQGLRVRGVLSLRVGSSSTIFLFHRFAENRPELNPS
jgi:hypothetical protein